MFAFAPFGVSGVAFVTLALLFWQWQRADVAARRGAGSASRSALGLFGAGASWLYDRARHVRRHAARWLAVDRDRDPLAYLALWPALAGCARRALHARRRRGRALVVAAGAFTLAEWLRGYVFTGFPWLSLGYAQVPDGLVRGLCAARRRLSA